MKYIHTDNMKKYKAVCWTVLLGILFISCQPHYTKNETLLRAEAILFTSPDSASRILTSIVHPEKLSKADYAAWCLLYTHAQSKLHKEITSDSLIQVSILYYKDSKMVKQSATAFYLLGCMERNLHKNEKALEAFKQAEYILKGTNENSLKGMTAHNIGNICRQDERYIPSLAYFRKSLQYFKFTGERNYQAYAYRDISNMYYQLDYPFDSVLHYSNLALRLSKEAGDSANYFNIMARQGELLHEKDHIRSNEYLLQGYRFFPAQRPYYASLLAFNYTKLHQPDSAKYYLQISLNDTAKINSHVTKYLVAAYLAKEEGNNKLAYDYMEKAYNNRDTVFQQRIRNNLHQIDKQFDLTRKEEENAVLKIANQKKVIWIALVTIAGMIIILLLLLINKQHKKRQAIQEIEKQQLEFVIQVKQLENNQKKELLLSKLQNRVENTLRFNRLNIGVLNQEKKEEFMDEMRKQSTLGENEWQYYIDEVNNLFDQQITHLSLKHIQLTSSDKMVITLVCLGLDISDCCSLLNMKKNAMYHRRNIIKERMGLIKEEDLEDWINKNVVV